MAAPSAPTNVRIVMSNYDAGSKYTIQWNASVDPDGDAITYQWEAGNGNNSSFGTTVLGPAITPGLTSTEGTPSQGTRVARVRAYDGTSYSAYSYSPTYTIVESGVSNPTGNPTGGTVTVDPPVDVKITDRGSSGGTLRYTITWSDVPGAVSYQLGIKHRKLNGSEDASWNDAFSNAISPFNVDSSAVEVLWRIRSQDINGNYSDWIETGWWKPPPHSINYLFGVNGVARKIKKEYFGVNGVARKVKKCYIGVNGVARLFYAAVTALQTPNLSVTGSFNQNLTNSRENNLGIITATWGSVPDATHYYLDWSPDGTNWSYWYDSANAGSLEWWLTNQTKIAFRVRAYNGDFEIYSSYMTSPLYTINKSPSTPASISVNGGAVINRGNSFTVSWGSVSDPEGSTITYQLERSYNGTTWTAVTSTTSTSYTHSSISSSYENVAFRVRAVDSAGIYTEWRTSSLVAVNDPPSAPTNITHSGNLYGGQSYTVTWGASSDPEGNAITYEFYYTDDGVTRDSVTGLTTNSKTGTFDVSYSGTVIFYVRAKDSNGLYSAWVSSPSYTLAVGPPSSNPTITGAGGTRGTSVTISWTSVARATTYRLSYALDGTENYTSIGSFSGTSTSFTLPSSGSTIKYRMDCTNGSGASPGYSYSGSYALSATVSPPASNPTIYGAGGTHGQTVTISWSSVANTDYYHLLYTIEQSDGTQVSGDLGAVFTGTSTSFTLPTYGVRIRYHMDCHNSGGVSSGYSYSSWYDLSSGDVSYHSSGLGTLDVVQKAAATSAYDSSIAFFGETTKSYKISSGLVMTAIGDNSGGNAGNAIGTDSSSPSYMFAKGELTGKVMDFFNSAGTKTGTTAMSEAAARRTASRNTSYGFFAGGDSTSGAYGQKSIIEIFALSSGTKQSNGAMSEENQAGTGCRHGSYAVMGAGVSYSGGANRKHLNYFSGLTMYSASALTNGGWGVGSVSNGSYLLVGGGCAGSSASTEYSLVDVYNSSMVKTSSITMTRGGASSFITCGNKFLLKPKESSFMVVSASLVTEKYISTSIQSDFIERQAACRAGDAINSTYAVIAPGKTIIAFKS